MDKIDFTPLEKATKSLDEIIRESNRFGLLKSDLEKWTLYRQKRNMSSRIHDEAPDKSIATTIYDFKEDVHYLLNKLQVI